MKIVKKVLLLAAFLGAALISCKNTDDDEPALPVGSQIAALKVGSTVTYDGAKYLVTKNTFSAASANRAILELDESSSRGVISAGNDSAEEIAKNVEYIRRYLTNDFRANLLKSELGLTEYIELFPVGNKKEKSTKGYASLSDFYTFLNSSGNKIAKIQQKWQSNKFSKFYFGIDGTDEQTAKFNSLSEDEIREYEPAYIDIYTYPSDLKNKKQIEIRYNYFSDSNNPSSKNYKKVNFESIDTRKDWFCFSINSQGKEKSVYRTDVGVSESGKEIAYTLGDAISGSGGISLVVRDSEFKLRVSGDGKINGSTSEGDYKLEVLSKYFETEPIRVNSTLGENKTEKVEIRSIQNFPTDFNGNVKIKKNTSTDGGKNWIYVDGSEKTVAVSEIGENCDFMSVSTEKTTVNGTEVPASMTYHAHYAKNADGSYPSLDKYAKVTCYPVYDEAKARIIYKVTEKSINDYINAYKADFATLTAE